MHHDHKGTKATSGKPAWLKRSLPRGPEYEAVRKLISSSKLTTVCQEAKCPNMWECFSKKTATFMILGSRCTRNCRFCNVKCGVPDPINKKEPQKIARAAEELNLKYVVITSVTRDDLPDGGAGHFAETIREIRKRLSGKTKIEVLIPDFQGNFTALKTVMNAEPDVLNHNIETVPSLYKTVRPQAVYQRSLELLERAKNIQRSRGNRIITVKSGIMTGIGETRNELEKTFMDLQEHGCTILTIGQYLQPSKKHPPVVKYYTPEDFKELKKTAESLGFKKVSSGPFVRSSYQANQLT